MTERFFRIFCFVAITTIFLDSTPLPAASNFRKGCYAAVAALALGSWVAWGEGAFDTPAPERLAVALAEEGLTPADVRIDQFRQMHYDPDVENMLATALSMLHNQFGILQRIQNAPTGTLVFREGIMERYGLDERKILAKRLGTEGKLTDQQKEGITKEIELGFYLATRAFGKAPIPRRLAEMNGHQKYVLMRAGGAVVLWATGHLETLYPTETHEVNDLAYATVGRTGETPILPHNRRALRLHAAEAREIMAIQNVLREIRQQGNDGPHQVILIYGFRHQFEPYSMPGLSIHSSFPTAE